MSRVSEAIYLGIVTLLTNVCQGLDLPLVWQFKVSKVQERFQILFHLVISMLSVQNHDLPLWSTKSSFMEKI